MTNEQAIAAEALEEVKDTPISHEEALSFAVFHRADSNLARCYLELRAKHSADVPRQPVAWSPMSKLGLLRGIRFGAPTEEDVAIAEYDGDTIRYFCDAPSNSDGGKGGN